jgi:hypothetical protein
VDATAEDVMSTRTRRVQSFLGMVEAIEEVSGCIFRGVTDKIFPLIPKIGRILKYSESTFLTRLEREALEHFVSHAEPWLSWRPQYDWEWLALAQHHGAPTRLLDWTRNPLVAAFFACDSNWDVDGAIYCVSVTEFEYNPSWLLNTDPFAISVPVLIEPRRFSPRMAAQASMLVACPRPNYPLNARTAKIVVPAAMKADFLRRLEQLGVTHGGLFPGLDGVAGEVWADLRMKGAHGVAKIFDERVGGSLSVPHWNDEP